VAGVLADGVVRLGTDVVNWYLVADDSGVTVVDAAIPRYRPQLDEGLRLLGRRRDDVRAVVLTHGHVDHVGCAEQLRSELGIPVYVHEQDRELTQTGKATGKNEASIFPYLRHRAAWKLLFALVRGGARPIKVAETTTFVDGETLPVPGALRVIHTPGHTDGHCALWFEARRTLVAGDLLATRNPLTGVVGPQLMPRAFTRSSEQALDSLHRIEDLDAHFLLPGHGEPWTESARLAVERARVLGPT
jgi:glyoxylase-like metal-dependent hydrolase (beta-lactamase superfamily II)